MKSNKYTGLKLLSLLVFVFLGISSCVTELGLEFFSYQRDVVVDGGFTNEEKVQEVRLSYAVPVGIDSLIPLRGAKVWVEDDLGAVIDFVESSPGVYATPGALQGIEGRSYKLVFVTENGKRYQSTEETLMRSPAIEISERFAELPSAELIQNEQGLQFFIDTPDGAGDTQFFRYEWNDASKTTVPYPARFKTKIIAPDRNHPEDRIIVVSPQERDLETCYRFGFSNSLILGNTIGLSENSILDQHVRFASMERLNFMERYSIEVIQYAISQQAFNYYRLLKEFNESNGSLFDTQQGIVLGNIKSLDDEGEVVLGYFEVSGVSRQRKFYNPDEFNEEFTSAFIEFSDVCAPDEIIVIGGLGLFGIPYDGPRVARDAPISIDYFPNKEASFRSPLMLELLGEVFVYDFGITGFFPFDDRNLLLGTGTAFLAPGICVDCTRHGEIAEKPTYWID